MVGQDSRRCALSFAMLCLSRADVQYSGQDMIPNLEISLAPPIHPWPQVAAEIGNLDASREAAETAQMNSLQTQFNKASADAKQQIANLIAKTLSTFSDPALSSAGFHKRCALCSPVQHLHGLGSAVACFC